jgi:hypothetical protein
MTNTFPKTVIARAHDIVQPLAAKLAEPLVFTTLSLLGYAALFGIHLGHDLPWLSSGQLFPDLIFDRRTQLWVLIAKAVTLGYLFTLYGLGLLHWKQVQFDSRTLFTVGSILAIAATCILPADSADIFAYIGFGRIAGIYGLNPYLHGYAEIHDFYTPYAWFQFPMPYGPAVLPFFIAAGWLANLNVLSAVYLLKVFWLGIHSLNCLLLKKVLAATGRDIGFGLFLFACNPLLLLDLLVNGHNDGVLVLCALLTLFALLKKQHTLSLLFAALAAMVKLSGLFVLAPVAFYLWRQGSRRPLIIGILLGILAIAGLQHTFFPNAVAVRNLLNPNGIINQNSIHQLLISASTSLGTPLATIKANKPLFSLILASWFIPFCLWQLIRIRSFEDLVRTIARLLLMLLVGFSAQFYPWYLIWLLPCAALTNSLRLQQVILVFTCSSIFLYAFPYSFFDAWLGWRVLRLALTLGPPLALFFWLRNDRKSLLPLSAS